MSKKMIITIGREYGSGGRIISTKLAEKLGIAFYDKNLIELATAKSGLDPKVFSKEDEKAPGLFISPYAPTTRDQLYMASSAYIRELAEGDESCLIVGRCSNAILEGRDDVINIFIYAPLDYRIDLCMETFKIDTKERARKEILKADRVRKNYYEYFTEYAWGAREGYNLLVDSSLLGIDGTVDMLAEIITRRFAE